METEQINFLPQDQRDQNSPLEAQDKKPSRKSVFLFLGLIIAGILIYSYVSGRKNSEADNQNPVFFDSVTLEPKKPKNILQKLQYIVFNRREKQLAGEINDRVNVLLLGIGGRGHDGPYLSDTILLASIKPSTKQLALVSIPRDLAVNIPGYGVQKVNSADAYGETKKTSWGGAYATEIISKTLNIDIPYYIRVDFTAFEEIINEVGGIKIDVEKTFTDTMFPDANDLFQTVSFKKGVTTMNGGAALKFARSRHGDNGEGSDFARSKRQQKILVALKEKVLSYSTLLNPIKINSIINSLESHITTNMEFSEIMTMIKMARELDTSKAISLTIDDSQSGYLRSAFSSVGAYILVPKTGNFNEINHDIKNIFLADNNIRNHNTPVQDIPISSSANIEIQNGTWNAGLASRIKKRLNNKSIQVETVGNSMSKPIEHSAIYQIHSSSTNDTLVQALINELQIPSFKTSAGDLNSATSTDILILIGEDFID